MPDPLILWHSWYRFLILIKCNELLLRPFSYNCLREFHDSPCPSLAGNLTSFKVSLLREEELETQQIFILWINFASKIYNIWIKPERYYANAPKSTSENFIWVNFYFWSMNSSTAALWCDFWDSYFVKKHINKKSSSLLVILFFLCTSEWYTNVTKNWNSSSSTNSLQKYLRSKNSSLCQVSN